MNEQMERLKERAEWHESMADDHASMETPFGLAAAQRHREMAQDCWTKYGRMMAEVETFDEWTKEQLVILKGVVLK
ncbi:hypothetical protein P4S95_21125 [Aneurinibacillus aneurinilyticus]|uniref:hypothetical protein n=1 Tax=Aneurinibacillus aneurinilyticus TaxID=1391 RepID=UPI002E1E0BCF|nr:hypothetical protein [Aneurinibacillus aneurinilyticus]